MRNRTSDNRSMPLAGTIDIANILAAASQKSQVFGSLYRTADERIVFSHLLPRALTAQTPQGPGRPAGAPGPPPQKQKAAARLRAAAFRTVRSTSSSARPS